MFVKGAPESVLSVSNLLFTGTQEENLSAQDKQRIQNYADAHAMQAMRNLAYAYKKITLAPGQKVEDFTLEDVESGLTFLGVVSMIDPPREEVHIAMQAAHNAQIKIVMITGDYALTAKAIAAKV